MGIFFDNKNQTLHVDRIIGILLLGIVGLWLVTSVIVTVPVGNRGILMTWGAYTSTLGEGFHLIVPVAQSVVLMNVQTSKYEATASAATKDLLDVSTKVAVNYHISPDVAGSVYQKIGIGYENKIIAPAVQEVVKATTAKYQAGELVTNRVTVKNNIDTALADRLLLNDILLETVSITDFEFPESFNQAILDSQTATRRAIEAENQLKTIQFQAQQVVVTAQGQADAKLAIATAEAKAIEIQGQALKDNPEVAVLRWIDKWSGVIPPFSGTNSVPIVNLPSDFFNQIAIANQVGNK